MAGVTRRVARTRDRVATETRILAAARALIAREGFGALGVNALAAEAGCDKKLIARYFGGLDGVVAALGADLGTWVAPAPAGDGDHYGARIEALLAAYAAHLRADPLLQQVLAWELVAPSPALTALEARRATAVGRWMHEARGALTPPPDVDAPAINAVLLAALHYLTLRARTLPTFAGMDVASRRGRARVDAAFRALLRGAYGAPDAALEGAQ
jgi:AcrR family transcriptional regulator